MRRERTTFEGFAGGAAIVGGVLWFLYSLATLFARGTNALSILQYSAAALIISGLLFTFGWVAIYARIRETDAGFGLWAFLMGLLGAIGSIAHGGYDLAASLSGTVPTFLGGATVAQAVNPIDPRGLLNFGFVGLSLLVVGWLIIRGGMFSRALGYESYLVAILYIWTYLAWLLVADLNNPVLTVPFVLGSVVAGPVFWVWTGVALTNGLVDAKADEAKRPDLYCCSV